MCLLQPCLELLRLKKNPFDVEIQRKMNKQQEFESAFEVVDMLCQKWNDVSKRKLKAVKAKKGPWLKEKEVRLIIHTLI